MAGRPSHPRGRQVLEDYRTLKARGLTMSAIAQQLGMSRATLYRILAEQGRRP